MSQGQQRIKAWVVSRKADLGVTEEALASAIDRSVAMVRKTLAAESDAKVTFDHMMAWSRLLRVQPDELVAVWAECHGIVVDVVLRQPVDIEAAGRGVVRAMGEHAASIEDALADDGVIDHDERDVIRAAEDKAVRAIRRATIAAQAMGAR